jgi:hypothetical protein
MISAVFRKGGDVAFLVEELKSVHDPKGGFFHKGKYIPSLVAAIGGILETHLVGCGLLKVDTSLVDAAKAMVAEKIAAKKAVVEPEVVEALEEAPAEERVGALCEKCHSYSVVVMDGCLVCVGCGNSKCS